MGWGRSSRSSPQCHADRGNRGQVLAWRCVCGERISFRLPLPLTSTDLHHHVCVLSMCIVARGRLTFIIKCTAINSLGRFPHTEAEPRTAYRLRPPVANSRKGDRKMIYSM